VTATRCPRCDAAQEGGAKFCVRCGYDLRVPTGADAEPDAGERASSTPARIVDVRLTACPACGATNAESRRFCGRCRADLDDPYGGPQPLAPPDDEVEVWVPDAEAEHVTPAVFIVAVTLAGLALGGVILTILSAQGIGLFAGPPEPEGPPEPVALDVRQARASSELPPSGDVTYVAANVLDGNAESAWSEGASGDGTGEWIELVLTHPAEVSRLVVWNGYQKDRHFDDNARVARVRIELGERRFDADLLDVRGPQAVDLPETVRTDRVRLTIMGVHAGRRYEDVALSNIEVRGPPPEAESD
jgi:hypothetical protein